MEEEEKEEDHRPDPVVVVFGFVSVEAGFLEDEVDDLLEAVKEV